MGGSLTSDISWTMAVAGLHGDVIAPPAECRCGTPGDSSQKQSVSGMRSFRFATNACSASSTVGSRPGSS